MAAQTLTDVTRNYDDAAISGLLNGETITINNSNLIINSDSRWGQQAAVMGSLTISATLGGSVLIDGRDVWWMPYDGGTGNVPSLGTVGVNDITGSIFGAGEFLGVFTALGTAPVAAGSVMPSTGFIKFRRVTSSFVDNEVMTFSGGATASVNSSTGGQRGWIHVVGVEVGTANIPRLGTFQTRGEWFELGTTNGSDDQTFQFPVTDACPAIQIETSPGSGIYEWWLNAGARWGATTSFVPQNEKGKYFGMDNATGVITIARRSSNACGFKPASGCKVRIPNIILSGSNSTNWNANVINAALANRYDFTTTTAGKIDIQGVSCNWYLSFASPFSVVISNSSALHAVSISNVASTTTIQNFAIGLDGTTDATPLTLANLFSGGLLSDIRTVRYSTQSSGFVAISVNDCEGLNFERVQAEIFGGTTAITRNNVNTYTMFFIRANNFTMDECTIIGARLEWSACSNIVCNNIKYADLIGSDTTTTIPQYAIYASSGSSNIIIDGFSSFAGLSNQQPYGGIVAIMNSYFVTLRDIGTPSAPYNMGTVNAAAFIANASVAANLTFRRIYAENSRTAPFSLGNTVQNVIIENVWGDGLDTQAILALNVTPKGCRWTRSTTTQSSVYGRHWEDAFTSTTSGYITIAANEPLAATADQVSITAGTPAFTSGGQIAMRTAGDQVVWTCPYFILGYTSLANVAPVLTGTGTANINFEYQIDTGSGFGSYKALSAANLSSETISPTTGFRLKVRATTTVANSTNALSYISIQGTTNATDQQIQYPLPFNATALVTGIVPGSRIQIYNVTTSTEIKNEIVSGSSFSYGYYNGVGVSSGDVIRIRLAYVNGATARLPQETIAIASPLGFSALASQELDTVYNTNAIDGSTVTELTSDYPNIHVDSNDVDGETTVQRIYAWFVNNRATEEGIDQYFNAITAEDLVNYKVNASVVDLKIDNIISTPLQIIGGRIYRDDGATIIAATSNSIQIDPSKAYGVEVGTSGLTPSESETLNKLNALTEDVSGLRFTAKALEEAPAGGGGGSLTAADVWTYSTRTLTTAIPTAAQNATAVRSELTTELGRIDVAIGTRLSSASYVAPANSDITAIKAKTDNLPTDPADESSIQAAIAAIPAAPTASTVASAVRTELNTELSRIDATISSRLATAGYTAPDNATIGTILTEVNTHPTLAEIEASSVLAKEATVAAIPTDTLLSTDTRLNNLDATISSRLAASGYTAPANSDISAIKAKTDNLPVDPADNSEILAAISSIPSAPSASSVASAVRTELSTELARVDVAVSSRNSVVPDNAGVAAIKAKTDNLPVDPASESTSEEIKKNTNLIPAAL